MSVPTPTIPPEAVSNMDQAVSSSVGTILQYGILGVACLVMGFVIVVLYRRLDAAFTRNETQAATFATERQTWALREQQLRIEGQQLRIECEGAKQQLRAENAEKLNKESDDYAKELREIRVQAQAREDNVRKEFTEVVEALSADATKTSLATADVINKLYDRILPPRRG